MSIAELQNKIIKKIVSVENDRILKEVISFIEFEMDDESIVEVTAEQKNAIDEARMQIKNGQYSTNDELDKEIDEWLKE